jgi:hypothetical protein
MAMITVEKTELVGSRQGSLYSAGGTMNAEGVIVDANSAFKYGRI